VGGAAACGAGGAPTVEIPDPPPSALHVGVPAPAPSLVGASRWARVRRPVMARVAPSASAPAIGRLETRTPEGTTNLVATLGRRQVGARLWVRAMLPVLPTGAVGWVPRGALGGYGVVYTHLVVDLDRLTAVLLRRDRRVFSARIGVGTSATPTPRGEFYVRNRLTRYRSPTYGPLAFGTSARSPTLTDWPAGGFVGIHGTDRPDLLPGRVSHGCIRMTNRDVLALGALMPVGTRVTIR
jgi:hypothetical protein